MNRIAVVGGTSALAHYLVSAFSKDNEVTTMGRHDCDVQCDLMGGLQSIAIPKNADVVIQIAASL